MELHQKQKSWSDRELDPTTTVRLWDNFEFLFNQNIKISYFPNTQVFNT